MWNGFESYKSAGEERRRKKHEVRQYLLASGFHIVSRILHQEGCRRGTVQF
jgi:hypothetical protein